MKDDKAQELAEVFCKVFHRQVWDNDCEEPSEINRIAWRNCVKAVIEAYEKQKEH